MLVAALVMALAGRVGDGVFGQFEEAADVKDEREPEFDAMELTLGDDVPDEYAWPGRGRRGRDGSLSLLIKDNRYVAPGAFQDETSGTVDGGVLGINPSFSRCFNSKQMKMVCKGTQQLIGRDPVFRARGAEGWYVGGERLIQQPGFQEEGDFQKQENFSFRLNVARCGLRANRNRA